MKINLLHKRKATSTGFGSSVNSSSNHQSVASAKEDSFSAHTHSQSSESVNERSHTTKDDDILALLEIEKKDVLEELDANRQYNHCIL